MGQGKGEEKAGQGCVPCGFVLPFAMPSSPVTPAGLVIGQPRKMAKTNDASGRSFGTGWDVTGFRQGWQSGKGTRDSASGRAYDDGMHVPRH